MRNTLTTKHLLLLLGSFLIFFSGLRSTFFLAPWVPMIFFIHYFREKNRWYEYLYFIMLLAIPNFFIIHGAWHMPLAAEVGSTLIFIVPLTTALLLDKLLYKKTTALLSSLVFPATYVILDFLIGLTKLGNINSIAITQFTFKPLIQIASVTGLEGISFMVLWFSTTVATLWGSGFNLKKERQLATAFITIFFGTLIVGGLYFTLSIPEGKSVRVAGITSEHKFDAWNIIDKKTPKDEALQYVDQIKKLEDELFERSEKAANFGAKIIFWSEANGIIYDYQRASFLKKAQNFAKKHQVYFAPTTLTLKFDTYSAKNEIFMIAPDGKIAFDYEKTISWYPSESDGIIDTLETPYGKIASVICFDADFPRFLRKVAKEDIDILILPKFDTKLISPGHTYSGFFRGIEGGYSIVSQVNKGVSAAMDYRGNVLAYQDFFTTDEQIMIADIPTKGRSTIYTFLGDWFIYLNVVFLTLMVSLGIIRKKII